MPELPEVETVRRELEPWLTGRCIRSAERRDAPPGPKYANLERATGQRIESVGRRGKFLLLPLSAGDELIEHLGMTGVISSTPPPDHLRVELSLSGRSKQRLYFRDVRRFGRFLVVPRGDYRSLPTLHHLGPEPMSDAFTAAALARSLAGSKAPIKALIMGQRPVAGVGNIYTDESLWRAGIHPKRAGGSISKRRVAKLRDAIVEVIGAAIVANGTTLSDYRTVAGGTGGYAEQLNAYGHAGRPCPRCGATFKRAVIAQRGTSYCPRCQR